MKYLNPFSPFSICAGLAINLILAALPNISFAADTSCNIPHYQNIISKLHSQLDAIGELKLQAEVTLETYQTKGSATSALSADEHEGTAAPDSSNPKVQKYKKILDNSLKNKIKKNTLSSSSVSFSLDSSDPKSESEKQFTKEAEDIFNSSRIRSAAILEILKDTNKIALAINKPSSDIFEEMARANDTSSLIIAATAIIQQEFDSLEINLSNSIEKLESACKESKKIKIQKAKSATPTPENTSSASVE